jgi:GntR family transcriptional regulator/MocR family aminotransferase
MFPSLRVGYLVVPEQLVDTFERAVAVTGQSPPHFVQSALAEFMDRGLFTAHIRRMRRLYARRQTVFRELAQTHLKPWLEVPAANAGMQLIGWFREPMDDLAVFREAQDRGIDFSPLSAQYRHGSALHGMLLGYAGVDERQMVTGVGRLQDIFSLLVPPR